MCDLLWCAVLCCVWGVGDDVGGWLASRCAALTAAACKWLAKEWRQGVAGWVGLGWVGLRVGLGWVGLGCRLGLVELSWVGFQVGDIQQLLPMGVVQGARWLLWM